MPKTEKPPSPLEIRNFRGPLSKADFAAKVGVTPLTVYRWELPLDSEESRRPRGKVLARLFALMGSGPASTPARGSALHAPVPADIPGDERETLRSALGAIEACEWERAERALVSLLTAVPAVSPATRSLASIGLAKLQVLYRYDIRGAFATLSGAVPDPAALPEEIRLQYHLVAALLFALPDANLFLAGKAHHHAHQAGELLHLGNAGDRCFFWYAEFAAAAAHFEPALMARVLNRLPELDSDVRSPLSTLFVAEATTSHGLYGIKPADAKVRLDAFLGLAREHRSPLFEARGLVWKAEVMLEEAGSLDEALGLLEAAEKIVHTFRLGDGPFTMMLFRNRGEVLLRKARLQEAEAALLEAERIGAALRWTPVRIHTTLARLYVYCGRISDLRALASRAAQYDGWIARETTQTFAAFMVLLCDVYEGKASGGWFDELLHQLQAFRDSGAWAISYRYLATFALGTAAALASLEDARTMLRVAERALDLAPSAMAVARLRRYQAGILLREGHWEAGTQLLTAALATFELAENVPEAALVRPLLAELASRQGSADAARLQAEADAELARLGLRKIPMLPGSAPLRGNEPSAAKAPAGMYSVKELVIPAQRLATRGLPAHLLQRELLLVTGTLFPGAAAALFALDAAGMAQLIGGSAPSADSPQSAAEFSDGAGRHYRLVVGAGDERCRATLAVLAALAGQAFEIAALRGFASPQPETTAAAEPEVNLPGFIAASTAMRKLKGELARLSGSRATLIINGESGTGKEVVARAVHDLSARAAKPYITFNSAAVPRELFEGQLFGYRKGAFTGAVSDHPGVIRAAHGGTLFLDEIGELPLDIQPKLLRFLENGEIFPLGERKPVQVDVRVIAATHRNLAKLVREGKFREDLYYRLQVIPVHIPPLRERPEDILALARYFLKKYSPAGCAPPRLDPSAEHALTAYAWPGNVRELRNTIERTLAFEPLPAAITAADLRLHQPA